MKEPSEAQCLAWALEEHFNPGQVIEVYIQLREAPGQANLNALMDSLFELGFVIQGAELRQQPWPLTLVIVLPRPPGGILALGLERLTRALEPWGCGALAYR